MINNKHLNLFLRDSVYLYIIYVIPFMLLALYTVSWNSLIFKDFLGIFSSHVFFIGLSFSNGYNKDLEFLDEYREDFIGNMSVFLVFALVLSMSFLSR